MTEQNFNANNKYNETTMYPMDDYDTAQHSGFFEFVGSNSGDSISACNEEFLEGAKKPKQQIHNSISDSVRSAMVDRVRENRSLSQSESSLKNETLEHVSAAPSIGPEHNETSNLHKSISEVRELLVGPTLRQNESRLDEILTLIENSKKDNDQNIELLRKQFAQITLKLYDKTKISLAKLDERLDIHKDTMEKNRTEIHGVLAVEIAGLATSTDNNIQSLSGSIDARISRLTTKISGEMNNTVSELGRAISSVGNSIWQSEQ